MLDFISHMTLKLLKIACKCQEFAIFFSRNVIMGAIA